nr:MazG-like family protein [Sporosarcina sp. P17b]
MENLTDGRRRGKSKLNIQQLTDAIRTWAIYRGLDTADSTKQALKLGEEFGELCQGLAKSRPDEVKDALGDMFVVMTILAMQEGVAIEECVQIAYNEIKDRKGEMVNGVFVKEDDLVKG